MGVTALDIKKVCLRCVAVIIVAFVMPTGIWLYARSASRFGRVAAVAAGVAMGEYKPYFSADDDSKASCDSDHQRIIYMTQLQNTGILTIGGIGIWIWRHRRSKRPL